MGYYKSYKRALTYTPRNKIEFDSSGRALIYLYKPLRLTYISQYSKYLVPIVGIQQLIKWNPFYATFPAALPIMFVIETILLTKLYKQFGYLRHTVSEIYLHKDGQTVEIFYEKKFWRSLKSESARSIFFIPNLKTPVLNDDKKPLKGNLFPANYPIEKSESVTWSYKKFYMNTNNYFVIPRNPNYMNLEILIQVFSGKLINTSKPYVQNVEGDLREIILSKEQEFEKFE